MRISPFNSFSGWWISLISWWNCSLWEDLIIIDSVFSKLFIDLIRSSLKLAFDSSITTNVWSSSSVSMTSNNFVPLFWESILKKLRFTNSWSQLSKIEPHHTCMQISILWICSLSVIWLPILLSFGLLWVSSITFVCFEKISFFARICSFIVILKQPFRYKAYMIFGLIC